MRNRLIHRPVLHEAPAEGHEGKKPTWLELFYDLIFVAAFIQLGNGLSSHVSFEGLGLFMVVFIPLWFVWSGFTFFLNRYTVDDFAHRTLTFMQMFAVGAMAIAAPLVLEGRTATFSIIVAIALALVSVMHIRVVLQLPTDAACGYSKYWAFCFGVAALLWLASAALPTPWVYVAWMASLLVILGGSMTQRSQAFMQAYPIDQEHLSERYGLLTLIVFGESFVKVLSELGSQGEHGLLVYGQTGVLLLITCSLWWIYFDDVAGAEVRKGRAQWVVWLYSHLPLQMSVTIVGVAIKKAVEFSWDSPAPAAYRWLLAGSLAATLIAVAMIDSVTERRQAELSDRARVNVRWIAALIILVIAAAGDAMSGGMFLAIVLTIAVAQVVFDMAMAPFESAEHEEFAPTGVAELAQKHRDEGQRPASAELGNIVRKGTPSSLRRDLYFYFIEGSWLRVLVGVGFLFVTVNVVFAGLYCLDPASISDGKAGSFSNAFFFSVQTFATIGFGAMSPATPYGDMLVTIEAIVGMLLAAIVTGLVFAKVSHPNSSVLFSKPILLSAMDGKPTLRFRVANARGNDVVSAEVSVTALVDVVTAEGQHIRRLYELPLVRSKTPFFVLSWTVMHTIDEDSPLHGLDLTDPGEAPLGYIVTLMGHDGTYGQTIYARHRYVMEDLRTDERFEDIISQTDDGRLMIDFDKFHDTKPTAMTESVDVLT